MGSWDESCVLSGLPIRDGDPARAMVIYRDPYYRHRVYCAVSDPVPLCLPVQGEYNSYGTLIDIQEDVVTELLRQRLAYEGTVESMFDLVSQGKLSVDINHLKVHAEGGATWSTKAVTPTLVLIREDVCEYLSTTKQGHSVWEESDDDTSYYENAIGEVEGYLTWAAATYEALSEMPFLLTDMSALEGAKDYSNLVAIFQRWEANGSHQKEWTPYKDWIRARIESGEGLEEVRALLTELAGFQQLCFNVERLGLSFDRKPRGPQLKSVSDYANYLRFLLDIAEAGDE